MFTFVVIIGVIISIIIVSLIINKVFFSNELDAIQPYGELVEINGKHMHVYAMGEGDQTIVLLPGLGMTLTSADFGPLMRELSRKYTVVCIDYFGIGFSDEIDTPRTNENYTKEIREALFSSGFNPPYILMPFSASGIYCEYYAAKYPDEVSALILLDTTSSAEKDTTPKFVLRLGNHLGKFQQAVGMQRVINRLLLPSILGMNKENGYTKKEIDDFIKFANHVNNDTIANQILWFGENVLEVMEMEFPKEVPVLMLSADGYEKEKWKKYRDDHLKRLGKHAQYKVIAGSSHGSIYHDRNHRGAVCEAVDRFIYSSEQ